MSDRARFTLFSIEVDDAVLVKAVREVIDLPADATLESISDAGSGKTCMEFRVEPPSPDERE